MVRSAPAISRVWRSILLLLKSTSAIIRKQSFQLLNVYPLTRPKLSHPVLEGSGYAMLCVTNQFGMCFSISLPV